jgi:hypothetical protein
MRHNPWLRFEPNGPYVLDEDKSSVRRYNELVPAQNRKIIERTIPEPFIGNPDSARILLLGLNPGHSPRDLIWHERQDFRQSMLRNLKHETQAFPFYPLNPKFNESGAGEWWRKKTYKLQAAAGISDELFSQRLFVIEWFPYHTEKSPYRTRHLCRPEGVLCESQRYSFELAQDFMNRNIPVLLMRSRKEWAAVDTRFANAPSLINPQCASISPGNVYASVFEKLVTALQG